MDSDNGILYLIELESKKEINIFRKPNYETITADAAFGCFCRNVE